MPSTLLSSFIRLNQGLSDRISRSLSHTRRDGFVVYQETMARFIQPGQIIVDVGGGHECSFSNLRTPGDGTTIVGVDLSDEAMAGNGDVDEKRIADVVRDGLPFGEQEVDVVTSRWVLEHLENVGSFVKDSVRVLKPGGLSIHLVPSRFAWFAVLNRLLPGRLSHRLLFSLHPQSRGGSGFIPVYDRCFPSALKRLLEANGFEVVELFPCYPTNYTFFFVPLFLLSSIYEMTIKLLGIRNLCSTVVVVARRV